MKNTSQLTVSNAARTHVGECVHTYMHTCIVISCCRAIGPKVSLGYGNTKQHMPIHARHKQISILFLFWAAFSGRLMKMLLFLFFVAAIRLLYKQPTHKTAVSRQHFVVKVGHCEMTAPNQPGTQRPIAASASACNCASETACVTSFGVAIRVSARSLAWCPCRDAVRRCSFLLSKETGRSTQKTRGNGNTAGPLRGTCARRRARQLPAASCCSLRACYLVSYFAQKFVRIFLLQFTI